MPTCLYPEIFIGLCKEPETETLTTTVIHTNYG